MSWGAPGPGNEFDVLTHQSCSRTSRTWSCLEGFDGFSCRKMGTTCEQQCWRGLGLIWVSERVEGRKGKCVGEENPHKMAKFLQRAGPQVGISASSQHFP